MVKQFTKPALSLDEHLNLLEARGLKIEDRTWDETPEVDPAAMGFFWFRFRNELARPAGLAEKNHRCTV